METNDLGFVAASCSSGSGNLLIVLYIGTHNEADSARSGSRAQHRCWCMDTDVVAD